MTSIHAAIASTPECDATRALREARDALDVLKGRLPFAKHEAIEDPGLQATGVSWEQNAETHEARLSLYRGAPSNVLAWHVFKSPDLYDFSKRALGVFDHLEGIE